MQVKKPGKRPFYKYASPGSALAILKNGTVRYSSPLAFNDPFDIQAGLHFDFDIDTLHRKVVDRIQELVSSSDFPKLELESIWTKLILRIR